MKRVLLFLFCLLQPLFAAAQINFSRIDIVTSIDNPNTQKLAADIQRTLKKNSPEFDIDIRNTKDYKPANSGQSLIIAIGESTLPWLSENTNSYAGAISFLTHAAEFSEKEKSNKKLTAIFRDQPLTRQLHLAKLLLPNLHRVAIIRSDTELPINIKDLDRSNNLLITETVIDTKSEWTKDLSKLIQENDVLLGIDDSAIYNGETIRSILLTTYRHGKGMIGPSRSFVNAGSLASCYTAPEEFVQQLANMVATITREHKLPRPQYPKIFHVAINKQVANSLNISVPDEGTLSAWLQNSEGECGDGC